MQHCGRVVGGTMYSLRDQSGNPHVTIDRDYSGDIVQLRGKQNSSPEKKYWPMIKRFFDETSANDVTDTSVDRELVSYLKQGLA
jgi:hypothetical protein